MQIKKENSQTSKNTKLKLKTRMLTFETLKLTLETLNQKLDVFLVSKGVRFNQKKAISIFERDLSVFIQEFLINYGSGITLDQALKMTLQSQNTDERLLQLIHQNSSTIDALNRFASEQDRKEIWRLVRLINQLHMTGSVTSLFALEKYHDELWQQKLVLARKKSEIITVQLTFLLMLSLISVIMVVISPIMLML